MAVVVRMRPEQLPHQLGMDATEFRKEVADGIYIAAQRGRTSLVRRTPVHMGQLKNSWRVRRVMGLGSELYNDAPHAGIVEGGARPHPVSREGIEALTMWVLRKGLTYTGKGGQVSLRPSYDEARKIAWAIAQKIKKVGQKPTFFVKNAMGVLQVHLETAVAHLMGRHLIGGGNTGGGPRGGR